MVGKYPHSYVYYVYMIVVLTVYYNYVHMWVIVILSTHNSGHSSGHSSGYMYLIITHSWCLDQNLLLSSANIRMYVHTACTDSLLYIHTYICMYCTYWQSTVCMHPLPSSTPPSSAMPRRAGRAVWWPHLASPAWRHEPANTWEWYRTGIVYIRKYVSQGESITRYIRTCTIYEHMQSYVCMYIWCVHPYYVYILLVYKHNMGII